MRIKHLNLSNNRVFVTVNTCFKYRLLFPHSISIFFHNKEKINSNFCCFTNFSFCFCSFSNFVETGRAHLNPPGNLPRLTASRHRQQPHQRRRRQRRPRRRLLKTAEKPSPRKAKKSTAETPPRNWTTPTDRAFHLGDFYF